MVIEKPSKAHPPRVHIYLNMEPDDYSGVPALRAFFEKRHHGFHDTVEFVSKPEHEALLAEARARAWNEAVAQFKIFGTDGCITCEGGRVTLFVANRQCTQCAPASYERKKAAAQGAPVGEGE